ncbi:MAG TPA: NAD(P)-dependent oxidoreductase [Candidatus Saccharimonadales bacterium]|nr:NAD(P)-dependent oxidoreductase [Candidatus Saccharimonadales bacterium]
MPKIVVTNNQDLSDEQKQRLNSLGDVTYYDPLPQNAEEYLERIKGADIICSGTAGLQDAYAQLKNVYVTVAFVGVAFVDLDVFKKNNVTISNAPGANRHAVSEWIMFMVLFMMRQFDRSLNTNETYRTDGQRPPITPGLAGNKITILGKGNIGGRVEKIAKAYEMEVNYFKRGDDLVDAVKDADVVVDTLSTNPSTKGLLNDNFFKSMKRGSYFVTVTGPEIVDYDAMLQAIDEGILNGAASDCGSILVGDTDDPLYQKLLKHPKVHVTPHISYSSEKARQTGADIMIDNVEAWIKGKPQNVVA